MGLRPGPLGELVVRPQGDELFQCHGAARAGKSAVLRCGRKCGTCGRKSGGFARSTETAGSAYIRKHLATQGPSSALAASALFGHEPQQEDAMSRILKIAAALAVLASLGACTVVPPRVAYSGPSVGFVSVGPAPYYAAPTPYYAAPYYAAPAYGGYWRRGGYRHRHW
jgi:hypothetical protein